MFNKVKKFLGIFSGAMALILTVTSIGVHMRDSVVVSAKAVSSVYTPERLVQMLMTADNSVMPRGALIDALNLTYPDGKSYYSSKSNGCECNLSSTINPCKYTNPCDCKVFAKSIQCMAFAKYFYRIYNGTAESNLEGIKGDGKYTILTTNNLYDCLSKAGAQSYLRNSSHSVFIVSFTKTKVEFYDANYGGKCIVHHQTVSYADFIKRFGTLDFAYAATPDTNGKYIIEF